MNINMNMNIFIYMRIIFLVNILKYIRAYIVLIGSLVSHIC